MNIVAYGGGTNSTAMIIGLIHHGIIPDLILFSDTGAERPDTYDFIKIFSDWLEKKGSPRVKIIKYKTKDGIVQTLEEECIKRKCLPAIAYGFKSCSQKYKTRVTEKFCNNYNKCKEIWEKGEKINKYIGYDAGEKKRILCHKEYDNKDKKYKNLYPLFDWGWDRDKCKEEIEKAGLPLPGKSSCFFCPSMKKFEIEELWTKYPELFERAIKIERQSKSNLNKIKGLGRNWSWEDYYNIKTKEPQQLSIFDFEEQNISCGCLVPCGCFD